MTQTLNILTQTASEKIPDALSDQEATINHAKNLNPLILPLNDPDMTLEQAGGKCVNLSAMIQAGFPVPTGFVITTACYRDFVIANDLDQFIIEQCNQIDVADMSAFETASVNIRERFAQGTIPDSVVAAITAAYQAMTDSNLAVAVRSSATAEDLPDASFAGQQETYLNINGIDALLDATKQCWSSLWTARAIAYRIQQEISQKSVALAVAVQQMVPAEAAGVMFTVNPVTGNTDEIMINATWGLGEALVSGQVNPDTIVLDKATAQIKESQMGDKQIMTAPTATGTDEIEVALERRNKIAVSDAHLRELARLGYEIESHFGIAQDIEWATTERGVYILQSRPVTTLSGTAEIIVDEVPGDDNWWPIVDANPQPFDLWTQADVGERWPDPVTPLTWSTAYSMIDENMGQTFTQITDRPYINEIEWPRRMRGRVYMNEGAMVHAMTDGFGLPASMIAAALTNFGLITPENDRYRWGRILRTAPIQFRMIRKQQKDLVRFEEHFPQIDRWVDEFMARDLSTVNDQALWQEAEGIWYERLMHYMNDHASSTSQSMMAYAQLEKTLKQWLDRDDIVNQLISGLSDVISAEIVPSLWEMVDTLRNAGLESIVLNRDAPTALKTLRQTPDAKPFMLQFNAFLQRHGHRCATEAEWLYPRWIEAPEQVIESLNSYLQAEQSFDLESIEARQSHQREEAIALVEQSVGPLKRLHHLVRLRDNGQHYLVKLILPIRHIYATLGERWAAQGWLEHPEDFFFLVTPEIETVLKQGKPGDLELRQQVTERRQAHQYWHQQPFYDTLDAAGKPVQSESNVDVDNLDANAIAGIAASAGRVTGTARVVMTPQEANQIQPGEILVTRATDPGWPPVFSVISGVVLEIGGQLSHGAIVAREYGLPAVVNAFGATERIRDGQTITVDGTNGVVLVDV